MTPQVTADAAGRRLRELASALRRHDIGRQVARTAGYNVASAAAAGPGRHHRRTCPGAGNARRIRRGHGVVRGCPHHRRHGPARGAVLLRCARSRQCPRLCRDVAGDDAGDRYAALAGGILLAPLLARGNAGLTVAYRIAFGTSIVAFVGASYTFSLQARNLRWWNEVRVSQPVLSLAFLVVLWRLRLLTLTSALVVLALTMLAPARLGLLPLPVGRPGTRPGSGPVRPAPGRVRHGPDRGPDPGHPQRQARPTRPVPGRAPGGPGPVRDRGLVHPAPDTAGVGDRKRRIPAAGVETARGRPGAPDAMAGHPGQCLRRGGRAGAA